MTFSEALFIYLQRWLGIADLRKRIIDAAELTSSIAWTFNENQRELKELIMATAEQLNAAIATLQSTVENLGTTVSSEFAQVRTALEAAAAGAATPAQIQTAIDSLAAIEGAIGGISSAVSEFIPDAEAETETTSAE